MLPRSNRILAPSGKSRGSGQSPARSEPLSLSALIGVNGTAFSRFGADPVRDVGFRAFVCSTFCYLLLTVSSPNESQPRKTPLQTPLFLDRRVGSPQKLRCAAANAGSGLVRMPPASGVSEPDERLLFRRISHRPTPRQHFLLTPPRLFGSAKQSV